MNRPRRDPRAERQVRAMPAARPRFDLAASAQPAGRRPRRDPRREAAAAAVPGAARLRLDRLQGPGRTVGGPVAPVSALPKAPEIRLVESPAFHVVAVLEAPQGRLSRLDRQVLGAARLLVDAHRDEAGAVLALSPIPVEGVGAAGADRLAVLGALAADDPAVAAAALRGIERAIAPRQVVFADSGPGGDLARRLAVSLRLPILTGIEHFTPRAVARPSRGRRTEQLGPPPRLMTLADDRVADYGGLPCEARDVSVSFEVDPAGEGARSGLLAAETIAADPSTMSLSDSDFVVSAGNGVTDFTAFRALAGALRATPGASRMVCDAGFMPREAQVGASGTVLGATCYLALGIAGAPQHLQGVAGCEHVVAVNTDLHAAMVERAALAIVEDAQAVMPALVRLLAARRGGAS